MPELPEVETVVRELAPELTRLRIDRVEVLWERSVDGDSAILCRHLRGKVIEEIFRRGKYICWRLDSGAVLTVHLRMTGKLVFEGSEKDRPYTRVIIHFAGKKKLSFVDVRKFGKLKLWVSGEALLPKLGEEPLQAKTVMQVLARCQSRRPIKSLLLDQTLLAGVGNIYADEALYAGRIHPLKCACKLEPKELKALAREIPRILKSAIDNMGTTLSDYRRTRNLAGENQHYLKVYGRTGLPCGRCQTAIERIVIGQRGTHYCPTCQSDKG